MVLGISGGADSVALLELFVREVVPRFGSRISAVHVNHRLRVDAGLDEMLVAELCADRGVPLHTESLDPDTRRRGQSMEMWAREQRYAVFARAAAHAGAGAVLTAHHRDDVVETFCLRLWRGTGIAGLAGIPFSRFDGVTRPLLPIDKASLRAWLLELGTPWREDESNGDARIPRNWVRNHLLPEWRVQDKDLDARIFKMAGDVSALMPAYEKWTQEEHPEEEVVARGGIPVEWLRAGMEASVLKALLRALGIADPAPELAAEILRQATGDSHRAATRTAPVSGKIRVRADPLTVLTEKHGILVATRSIFKRPE
jgi:tRNA(Ile)-lysidine synthase